MKTTFLKSIANFTYDKLAPNLGTMLLWTGTVGWILSATAQVTAVVINNKIPKEQKKFLIPQEMADAAVNIASFVVLTRSFQKFGERLVESGKLTTPVIKKFFTENISKRDLSKKTFELSKIPAFQKDKEFQKDFYKFVDGASFIFSTIGSIISCNIVTPLLRNKFAADRQKIYIAEEKKHLNIISPAPLVLPAQNRFGLDEYKQKVNLNSQFVLKNTAMKV
jgi:hypothetical protein